MCVDPLAEKYAYNSTYAFQENKMGLGRELEGLELIGWNQIAAIAGVAIATFKSNVSNSLKSALGNDGQSSIKGNKTNVNIAGYNVAKVKDLSEVTEAGKTALVKSSKNAANVIGDAMEKTGDTAVIIAPAFGPAAPSVSEAGELISKTGTAIKATVDVANGDYNKALEKAGTEVISGIAGKTVVKLTGTEEAKVNSVVTGIKTVIESKTEDKK